MPRRFKPAAHPIDIDDDRPIATKPKNWPATGTRTGTACPTCKREQMWCPSGVVCSDFENCEGDTSENQGSPSDIPFDLAETACPKCRSKQIRHGYGVICSNDRCDADTKREPSNIPFAATETDQGESLDEALASMPKERPAPRKGKAKGTDAPSPDLLELGEMGRIVERVFKFDFDEAYREVTDFLKPGDDRRLDLGFLQRELDRGPEMAALAHRLFTNAREACEIFEIDKGLIVASMREAARYKLDEDRRNRIRLKAVTDADVLGMMQMQDPAKWRDHRIKTVRMEATRDHLERLSDLARKRIDVLKTLVERK